MERGQRNALLSASLRSYTLGLEQLGLHHPLAPDTKQKVSWKGKKKKKAAATTQDTQLPEKETDLEQGSSIMISVSTWFPTLGNRELLKCESPISGEGCRMRSQVLPAET